MPSRRGVALIVSFWLAVTGYVVHRDVWPRLFADAPPAIRIDLSDEATHNVPARWTVYRGEQKVGALTTRMAYDPDENTFRFTSSYKDLRLDVSGLRCEVPELETTITVTRAGALRGQSMEGKLIGTVMAGPIPVFTAEATAAVVGVVEDGHLVGRCRVTSTLGDVDEPLDPVPVPAGQVLNPLQPVNRLRDVRPGARWVIREVDPLFDALAALGQGLLKKHAGTKLANFSARPGERPELVARVSDRPEPLPTPLRKKLSRTTQAVQGGEEPPVECWVIEYRGEKASAKTWVRVTDGKVLRQEATREGETLLLEREE